MTLAERMSGLEQVNRRLRFTVAGLAALIGLSFVAGMTAAAPDELTLRKLRIVDGSGTTRIVLDASLPNGLVVMAHYDKDGIQRIGTTTTPNGNAATSYLDKDGKQRITINTTPSGYAATAYQDTNGKVRIVNTTFPNGMASMIHLDKDGIQRIVTKTTPDGVVSTVHSDKNERDTVHIGVASDGTGMISVYDPTGRENSSQLVTRPR